MSLKQNITDNAKKSPQERAKLFAEDLLRAGVIEPQKGAIEKTVAFLLSQTPTESKDDSALLTEIRLILSETKQRHTDKTASDLTAILRIVATSPLFQGVDVKYNVAKSLEADIRAWLQKV